MEGGGEGWGGGKAYRFGGGRGLRFTCSEIRLALLGSWPTFLLFFPLKGALSRNLPNINLSKMDFDLDANFFGADLKFGDRQPD